MTDKATIEIDCDAGTVSVFIEPNDLSGPTKAELVADLLAMWSRSLMVASETTLMARYLLMLNDGE